MVSFVGIKALKTYLSSQIKLFVLDSASFLIMEVTRVILLGLLFLTTYADDELGWPVEELESAELEEGGNIIVVPVPIPSPEKKPDTGVKDKPCTTSYTLKCGKNGQCMFNLKTGKYCKCKKCYSGKRCEKYTCY